MVDGRLMFGLVLAIGVATPAEARAQEGPVEFVLDALGDFADHSARSLSESWDDAYWTPADYEAWRADLNFRYRNWDYNPNLQVNTGPRCPIIVNGEHFDCEPWEPGGIEDEFSIGDTGWSTGYSIDLRGKALPFKEENLVFGLTLRYTY